MTKEQKEQFAITEKIYKLNRELMEKIEKLKPVCEIPSYFETDGSMPEYNMRVVVYVEKKR